MRIEKNRHLIILDALIKNTNEYISSESLAHITTASIRTVKSDISFLNSELEEDGSCYISSRKSRGYQLVVTDEKGFGELKNTIHIYRILFYDKSIESVNRRLHILQTMLSREYTKVDDIADALFVSRSTITKDLSWADRFLASYGIQVVSTPGYGLHLKGKEQDIRSVMTEVYCSQYHDIELLYPVDDFNAYFDNSIYEDVRHELLKVLRESDLSFPDVSTKKLATYLCLIKGRHEKGFQAEAEYDPEIEKSYEYSLARKVFQLPLIRNHIPCHKNEIYQFARLLLFSKDVDLNSGDNHCSKDMIHTAEQLCRTFQASFGIPDSVSSFFEIVLNHDTKRNSVCSIVIRILLQHKYDHPGCERLITYTETGENNYSPVSMEITRQFILLLQKELNTQIRGPEVRALAAVFHYCMKTIPVPYTKRNIAVFSMEGKAAAQVMKAEILSWFSDMISRIDVFDLYEMRRIRFEDYDAAVSSWDIAYYRYPVPLVSYKGVNATEDRKALFRKLFKKGYSESILMSTSDMLVFHKNHSAKTYMELFDELSGRYAKDRKHKQEMLRKMTERYSTLSYYNANSGVSVIFLDYSDTGKEIFEIYEPAENVLWGASLEIRYFVVVCIHPHWSVSDVRLFDRMLQMIFQNRRILDEMKTDMKTVWKSVFDMALEQEVI